MNGRRLFGLGIALLLIVAGLRAVNLSRTGDGGGFDVALAYRQQELTATPFLKQAYDSVLQEEGISHTWVEADQLTLLEGRQLAARYPVIVFPDGLNQTVPSTIDDRMRQYLDAGGNLAVMYDAGVRDSRGAYRPAGLMADVVGVEYLRYQEDPKTAYTHGNVHFATSATALRWNVPPGKLYQGSIVGGYAYGSLNYPMTNARITADDVEVVASSRSIPVITLRHVGRGLALWVNLPLGALKAYSDDLPLRSVLRTFLLDLVGLPHLVPSPGGVGGLVIDWHIDSSIEWDGIPALLRHDLVRSDLVQQFDVAAGPFRDVPGDGLGFDACGRGEPVLRTLLPYGVIGSHGGWAHNWFSAGLEDGSLSPDEAEKAVHDNIECLERVTGSDVEGYSAPNGVHPQPEITHILEREGIRAYYYTGDTGSPPNRTFFSGHMITPRVWAFPVMPNGLYASFGEMIKAGLRPSRIGAWLDRTLDYVVGERTIRLVYSHPYDFLQTSTGGQVNPRYREVFSHFLDEVETDQAAGDLVVNSMQSFVEFLERYLSTSVSYRTDGSDLVVTLDNPQGLSDITVAVPGGLISAAARAPSGVEQRSTADGQSFTVTADATHMEFRLPLAAASGT